MLKIGHFLVVSQHQLSDYQIIKYDLVRQAAAA
jgi:hypothetical protein